MFDLKWNFESSNFIRKRKMCDKNVIQGPSPFTTWTNLMTTNFEEMRKP